MKRIHELVQSIPLAVALKSGYNIIKKSSIFKEINGFVVPELL
jgi:hypothetical protein